MEIVKQKNSSSTLTVILSDEVCGKTASDSAVVWGIERLWKRVKVDSANQFPDLQTRFIVIHWATTRDIADPLVEWAEKKAPTPAFSSTYFIHLHTVLADMFLNGAIRPMRRRSLFFSLRLGSVSALWIPRKSIWHTSWSSSFLSEIVCNTPQCLSGKS